MKYKNISIIIKDKKYIYNKTAPKISIEINLIKIN